MRQLAWLGTALLVAACATMGSPMAEEWKATLMSQGGTAVTGSTEARSTTDGTTATINIRGAASGARHPWHIHMGECGSNGRIVGEVTAYPVLNVGTDGRATATATINLDIGADDGDDDFYVNVHASPQDLGTIVACGELDD